MSEHIVIGHNGKQVHLGSPTGPRGPITDLPLDTLCGTRGLDWVYRTDMAVTCKRCLKKENAS